MYSRSKRYLIVADAMISEPETRAPQVKVVFILDDSSVVGMRTFQFIKEAAVDIAMTLAGKSETLNLGVWLAGGKAEMVIDQVSISLFRRMGFSTQIWSQNLCVFAHSDI